MPPSAALQSMPTLNAANPPVPRLDATNYDHVGIVVNDTLRTASRWAQLLGVDVPQPFNNAGPAGNLTYRGVHTDANILGSYISCPKAIGLEILQPTDSLSSFWLDRLRLYGNSPLYLGFASESWTQASLVAEQDMFTRVGCPTEQIGYWWQTKSARGCCAMPFFERGTLNLALLHRACSWQPIAAWLG